MAVIIKPGLGKARGCSMAQGMVLLLISHLGYSGGRGLFRSPVESFLSWAVEAARPSSWEDTPSGETQQAGRRVGAEFPEFCEAAYPPTQSLAPSAQRPFQEAKHPSTTTPPFSGALMEVQRERFHFQRRDCEGLMRGSSLQALCFPFQG